ncbi:MAG: GNAT family N-acetyltransferase [Myxococcales bacterium]|nr:GNAT family N-acetyltransferase [Myxococcales bacterium]
MSIPTGLALAELVERHQAEALRDLPFERLRVADGWAVCSGAGSHVNKAAGLGFAGPVGAADLDALVAFFETRGVEPKVELSSFAEPALLRALADRGLVLEGLETVLVRAVEPVPAPPTPRDVTLVHVSPTDEAALREAVTTSAQGFVPEGGEVAAELLDFALAVARLPVADTFVARADGRAVGAGSAVTSGGVTGLFGTSVAPGYRRRGIQQALIAARLACARARGSRLAYIVSLPGIATERNAARLGFALAYARVVLVKRGPGLAPSP